jgi:putative sigma-54 modulation protein
MQIDISARHFQMTDGLRDHVLSKMRKLTKYALKIESAHVVFDVQKIRQVCEIVLLGKKIRMTAKEQTQDSYASFDSCVSSLQKQLSRYHDRIKGYRHRDETEA